MPRGRKKSPENFDDEIAVFDAQIAELTKKLQALKVKRRARVKEEEKNKDANKWDLLKKSGLSVDQILDMVDKQK